MTPEQRRSFDNGIWLCQSCASLIDKDATRYPAALLRAWKMRREAEALLEINRWPGVGEGQRQMVAALSGYPGATAWPPIVPNAHRAVQIALERLDPRVRVQTSYINGRERIDLSAREDFAFSFLVPPARAASWKSSLNQVVTHGTAAFDLGGVSVKGSRLIEHMLSNAVTLEISRPETAAVMRLELEHEAQPCWFFAQLDGQMSGGSALATYRGSALEGMLTLGMDVSLTGGTRTGGNSLHTKDQRVRD
ncbi:hypothetical protein [Variovorax sp. KK3]|uniref:hypothetical protein n=1 Tax=Variovorax sp. KK3 TaxID=1855728 RepID=UPI00097C512B|nr:hypothetical protein [Variovorax sp. KK3]